NPLFSGQSIPIVEKILINKQPVDRQINMVLGLDWFEHKQYIRYRLNEQGIGKNGLSCDLDIESELVNSRSKSLVVENGKIIFYIVCEINKVEDAEWASVFHAPYSMFNGTVLLSAKAQNNDLTATTITGVWKLLMQLLDLHHDKSEIECLEL